MNKFNSRECGRDWWFLCVWENAKHNLQFLSKRFSPYKIVENPRNLVYLPVILEKINKMETVVTDQNGKQLNLCGENLTIRYHLREI